ncbi:MAG: type IV pilus assembly protein PilB [Flavobacteriaceae bacterium]|jgi:type IV pilus assembly protein PilB
MCSVSFFIYEIFENEVQWRYMYIQEDKIREFIIDSNLITQKDYAVAEQKAQKGSQSTLEILVSEGIISDNDMRRVQAYVLGIPFISLMGQHVDFDILSLIPEPIAKANNIIAYKKSEQGLEVAMLEVGDLHVLDFIKKKVGLRILPRLTDEESLRAVLLQYKQSLQADFNDIIQKEAKVSMKTIKDGEDETSEKDLQQMAEDLPIIKIVETLISHAILQNTSDIHIEPEEKQLIVRYRIDGVLRDAMILPKDTAPGIVARIKVLSSLKLDEKRLPQDGRFKIEQDGQKVSFRVSTLPTYYGEKVVIRILKENKQGYSLEKIGFYGEGLEKVHKAMNHTTGLILAAGPTGSGKTTTLYTMLDILNTPEVNISTVEDPIEYQMSRINQTQVKPSIGLTFANGLRALLRQDPDIIMVGEIRDNETASLAMNAALTGHLVLSTIHTNSAAGALPRMIDMGMEPFLIVSTLRTVIAQRLVRKLSSSKEKYFLSKEELAHLGELIDLPRMLSILKAEKVVGQSDTWAEIPFYRARKTDTHKEEYLGRIGIHEILEISPTIKNLVVAGATSDEIHEQAKKEGMMTMLEDGILNAVQGNTTTEEVLRVISE